MLTQPKQVVFFLWDFVKSLKLSMLKHAILLTKSITQIQKYTKKICKMEVIFKYNFDRVLGYISCLKEWDKMGYL